MDNKNLNTVQQYVGDMLALESHIEEALDGQLNEVKDDPAALALVQRFHGRVKGQREALRSHLQAIGGSEPGPVKELVANLFGKAAGVIDNLRTKGVSKVLRDDYTAFNHAAMGYAMLHATASMLGRVDTASVAQQHLRAYALSVKEIEPVIFRVVANELRDDGLEVNYQAASHASDTLRLVWQDAADTSGSSAGSTARAA
jgi:ferritin-like metal-binding protein YciE